MGIEHSKLHKAISCFHDGDRFGELNCHEDAIRCYDKAIRIKPDFAEAHINRAVTLEQLYRLDEALAGYDRALCFRPDMAVIHNNRGNVLRKLFRYAEALASYEHALSAVPFFPDALNNKGNMLLALGKYEEAAESFALIVAKIPDYDYAFGNMFMSRLYCCAWDGFQEDRRHIIESVRKGNKIISPFHFLSVSDSPADQLTCARTYSKNIHPPDKFNAVFDKPLEHEKIHVAYLSADFHNHAIAYLLAGLIEEHDTEQFHISGISFGPDKDDAMRKRLKKSFCRFIDVSHMADSEVAHLLRDLKVDIAVDLNGYTQNFRSGIFAQRPAPVQVSYLGYPGTMGSEYIDYIIADKTLIPPAESDCYSERIAYMPDTYQVNDSNRIASDNKFNRSDFGLSQDAFIYCCFNNNYKILPELFRVWMRILKRVERSELWLLEDNTAASHNLRNQVERHGVSASRLKFAPRVDLETHLARHKLADLFLDTFPYNAHTTASDALWAGLPIITCKGKTFAGRVAESLLDAVGMAGLVATSIPEYEEMAVSLAANPELLSDIQKRLAQNRPVFPLFNTQKYCRHIESAYMEMWRQYSNSEVPVGFEVADTSANKL